MEETRVGLLIYPSIYDALSTLPDADRHTLTDWIFDYHFKGIMPDSGNSSLIGMFALIKPNIDSASKKSRTARINGKKGGAPVGNQNARKQPNTTGEQPNTTDKQPMNKELRVKNKENDIEIDPDAKEIVNAYKQLCPNLVLFRGANRSLLKNISLRLSEYKKEDILKAFSLANNNPFYSGDNNKEWLADINYFFKDSDTIQRIINDPRNYKFQTKGVIKNDEIEELKTGGIVYDKE